MTVSSLMPCTGRAGIFKAHRGALWYCNMQCGLSSKGGGLCSSQWAAGTRYVSLATELPRWPIGNRVTCQ